MRPIGAGRSTVVSGLAVAARLLSLRHALRASVSVRHPLIRYSAGCRARDSRIVAAIMMPAEACMSTTSHAPTASIVTCRTCRRLRASALSVDDVRICCSCAFRTFSCCLLQRSMTARAMPMPMTASELRASFSASFVEERERPSAPSACSRVRRCVITPRVISAIAPIAAVRPSRGCISEMSSRYAGSHGASNIARTPGPLRKARSWAMSRSASVSARPGFADACSSDARIAIGASLRSRERPAHASVRTRTVSRK